MVVKGNITIGEFYYVIKHISLVCIVGLLYKCKYFLMHGYGTYKVYIPPMIQYRVKALMFRKF